MSSDSTTPKLFNASRLYSGRIWTTQPNSSWGEKHVQNFGDRKGYVICYLDANQQLSALASGIGQPFKTQLEIDANARLIASAPEMLRLIENVADIDVNVLSDTAEGRMLRSVIDSAEGIMDQMRVQP